MLSFFQKSFEFLDSSNLFFLQKFFLYEELHFQILFFLNVRLDQAAVGIYFLFYLISILKKKLLLYIYS